MTMRRSGSGHPRPRVLLWRGIRHRCPMCGAGGVFASWFRLRDRCPACGYRFVREPGFWLGAYVINFGVGEGLIGALLFGFAVYATGHEGVNPVPWLIAGGILGVLAPILFFPMSRTVWAAFDLMMHPLEPGEMAEAGRHRAAPAAPAATAPE